MLWKIESRLGEAFSLAFQSLSHPAPACATCMSARVCPYLRESRDGILPKREEDSKRKLSEQHEQTPHITHRFSTGQKAKLKLFLREFSYCFLTKYFCARKFSSDGCADQCADGFAEAFSGLTKSKIPHASVPRSNRSGSTRIAFALKGAPVGDSVR